MTDGLMAAIAAAREREESWESAGWLRGVPGASVSAEAAARQAARCRVWRALREALDAVPADHSDAVRITREVLLMHHAAEGGRRHAAGYLLRVLYSC